MLYFQFNLDYIVLSSILPVAYSVGCRARARTLFLWLVSTALVLPATKSHRRMVQSWLPVATCRIRGPLILEQGREAQLNHLRIGSLCDHICHSVGMASQGVDAGFSTHVPHLQEGGGDSDQQSSSAGKLVTTMCSPLQSSPFPQSPGHQWLGVVTCSILHSGGHGSAAPPAHKAVTVFR